MDGVLVDSEPLICKAALLMFEEKGLKVLSQIFFLLLAKVRICIIA
jgi:beta-phosphoglucomutase-like phosphatase (HAD superfamily)